jgi:hypothetical protein
MSTPTLLSDTGTSQPSSELAGNNHAPIPTKYTSFEPANNQQNGIKQTILGILHDTRRGPEVLADFQEELPPTVLLHQNVQSSTRLLKLVRDSIVESTGIEVQSRPRIVDWVKQTLYGSDPSLLDVSFGLISAYERTSYAEEKGERIVVVNYPAPSNNQSGEQTPASDTAKDVRYK